MDYISKTAELSFSVSTADYTSGDYCYLYSNSGSGAIDYDNPSTWEMIELFPGDLTYGWMELPWLEFPWMEGGAIINTVYEVTQPGAWSMAFQVYDSLGNASADDPEEVEIYVSLTPQAPSALKLVSYDKDTDILTLST